MTSHPDSGPRAYPPAEPPIVTLGPCGSGFLSVDPAIEDVLEHVAGHAAAADLPPRLAFFDARARELALRSSGTPGLTVVDGRERAGELRARIDELYAHARERLHRDPALLVGSPLSRPGDCRPPDDIPDLRRFLLALSADLRAPPPQDHVGSWWHNLFHRLGGG